MPIIYFNIIASEASEKKPADVYDPPTFNNSICSRERGARPLPKTMMGGHGRVWLKLRYSSVNPTLMWLMAKSYPPPPAKTGL